MGAISGEGKARLDQCVLALRFALRLWLVVFTLRVARLSLIPPYGISQRLHVCGVTAFLNLIQSVTAAV